MRHAAALLVMLVLAVPLAAEEAQPFRVVCFGDSVTGHRPGEAYRGQYLKFSDLLELLLEGRLGLGRARVVNSGWAGDATYPKPGQGMPGALARLDADLLAKKPDVAVVLIGGNDAQATDEDRARTRANLEALARRSTEAGIRLLMLQYPEVVPDPAAPDKAWLHMDDKNPAIAEAARAAGARVLDLGPAMKAAMDEHGRDALVAVDGVHLKPLAEMVYARAIFARLVRLGWVPAAEPEETK